MSISSIRDNKYVFGIIEYHTKGAWLYFSNNKEVFSFYKDFLEREIVRLRAADPLLGVITFVMDSGESKSNNIINLMKSFNILQVYTTYNTPEYNAIIERFWRTLRQMATAILLSSGLPDTFWEDAMLWALYI